VLWVSCLFFFLGGGGGVIFPLGGSPSTAFDANKFPGHLDEAISHLTEAIILNPRSAILYATRGALYFLSCWDFLYGLCLIFHSNLVGLNIIA